MVTALLLFCSVLHGGCLLTLVIIDITYVAIFQRNSALSTVLMMSPLKLMCLLNSQGSIHYNMAPPVYYHPDLVPMKVCQQQFHTILYLNLLPPLILVNKQGLYIGVFIQIHVGISVATTSLGFNILCNWL